MEFSPGLLNDLLGGMGQDVAWRRADECPCRDPQSGAALPGCAQCAGRGVTWRAPLACVTAIAGMKLSRQWAASGLWQQGDVVVSIPSDTPMIDAGANDRVSMLQSSVPFSVVIMPDEIVPLPYVVRSVSRVFWLDPQQNVIEGSLPTVGDDGTLIWADGAAPPAGTQYTVTGRRVPEYYVFQDLPGDRALCHGEALPRRVALRLMDLFGK